MLRRSLPQTCGPLLLLLVVFSDDILGLVPAADLQANFSDHGGKIFKHTMNTKMGFHHIATHYVPPNSHPGASSCSERYFNATLDHFSELAAGKTPAGKTHFLQRYFLCSQNTWKKDGPIFFYAGNEADVTLYVNATGIMWENAAEFGALLVFAEHRYYGKSLPFGSETRQHMQFLSSEQALADYATLLWHLKRDLGAPQAAVVAFGGSYGGMLATWLRLKYPSAVDGAVAGSAPIWTFYGLDPPYDEGSYAAVVTRDATEAAGAAPACAGNMRTAWKVLLRHTTQEELSSLSSLFRLCPSSPLTSPADVTTLAYWAQSAFDFMAMGNFPYASSYLLNGNGRLPAYPMRVACTSLADEEMDDVALIEGLRDAVGVFYNYTRDLECYDFTHGVNPETEADGNFWDYQYCTEMLMPMSRDGVRDCFFPQPFDVNAAVQQCWETWGVRTKELWAIINYGGRDLAAASNILWSNGDFDPWSGGGVLPPSLSDSLTSILIPGAAHHLDFMWSHPLDLPQVLEARALEKQEIAKWISQANMRRESQQKHSNTTATYLSRKVSVFA